MTPLTLESGLEVEKIVRPESLIHASIDFETAEGDSITTRFDSLNNIIDIQYLFVNFTRRRQGIGKQLLEQVKSEAKGIGAEFITAQIISRESLNAITTVFGEESINIVKEGTYNTHPQGERPLKPVTEAYLNYVVT